MFLSGSNFSYKYNVNNKITTLNKYLYVNGRIAFLSILDSIKKKKIKEIFLPNYICESLISVIDKNFFKINFYEVYDDFRISIPKLKNSIVLIINYFGIKHKLPNDIIKTNIIIEDKTFSFLNKSNPISKQKKNYYCFASFRKIHDGSIYAYSNILNKKTKKKSKKLENIYLNRIASSFLRDEYLKNENYLKDKNIENYYLKTFYELEKFFDNNIRDFCLDNILMYYSTKLLFYKTKKQFRRNINILKKEINSNYISKVNKDKNLLFLILKTKNKTKLLNFTRKYNIFLSSYWCIPNLLKNKKLSHNLYKNLVFLPNNNNLKKVQLVYLSKKINLFFKKHEN